MALQNRRLGCVQPRSQFLSVPRLTSSFDAKAVREKPDFSLYFISNSARDWVLFWQGCESTLMALITSWQKGFRNHPFRHCLPWFYKQARSQCGFNISFFASQRLQRSSIRFLKRQFAPAKNGARPPKNGKHVAGRSNIFGAAF
jgi:hypothetical protein